MAANLNIHDLGELKGRLLVFGGVYSNLQALHALQAIAAQGEFAPEQVICTGDMIGYCADPEACIQTLRAWGIRAIAGNVELSLREGAEACGCDFRLGSRCDLFSRQWYPYAQAHISRETHAWLQQLPDQLCFRYGGQKVQVLHGSYHHVSEYIFASTSWSIKAQSLADAQANIILAGHSGLPFHSVEGKQFWLNPGVIGMPANDGTPRVWYMVLEPGDQHKAFRFSHRELHYDAAGAFNRMQQEQLPSAYADTLLSGLWDNCEILPPKETAQQGQPLHFS